MTRDDDTILDEAKRLVYGDRETRYGHPFQDFSRTAAMWSALFGRRFSPEDVALAMCCVKLSRESNRPNRDNRVDLAGYAAALDRVVEVREENEARMAEGYRETAEQGTQPKEGIA